MFGLYRNRAETLSSVFLVLSAAALVHQAAAAGVQGSRAPARWCIQLLDNSKVNVLSCCDGSTVELAKSFAPNNTRDLSGHRAYRDPGHTDCAAGGNCENNRVIGLELSAVVGFASQDAAIAEFKNDCISNLGKSYFPREQAIPCGCVEDDFPPIAPPPAAFPPVPGSGDGKPPTPGPGNGKTSANPPADLAESGLGSNAALKSQYGNTQTLPIRQGSYSFSLVDASYFSAVACCEGSSRAPVDVGDPAIACFAQQEGFEDTFRAQCRRAMSTFSSLMSGDTSTTSSTSTSDSATGDALRKRDEVDPDDEKNDDAEDDPDPDSLGKANGSICGKATRYAQSYGFGFCRSKFDSKLDAAIKSFNSACTANRGTMTDPVHGTCLWNVNRISPTPPTTTS